MPVLPIIIPLLPAGSDYVSTSVDFHYGPGVTSLCQNVSILDDRILENLETFYGHLSTLNERVVLSPSHVPVTITDDDSMWRRKGREGQG